MGDYCCDTFMEKSWKCLIEDLGSHCGFIKDRVANVIGAQVRGVSFPDYVFSDLSPYTVKCIRQISQYFDRYRFSKDKLNEADLAKVAYDKFVATQNRLGALPYERSASTFLVVREARKIVKKILGPPPIDQEVFDRGSFSKRATTYCSLRNSLLHEKLSNITGSPEHLDWFAALLPTDPLLNEVINGYGGKTTLVDSLGVSFVPKSWKTFRTVTPNSLIGSYWSYGVGRILQDKLADVNLNIKVLQDKQRRLAQLSSVKGHLVTADLSAASDSFRAATINMLVPRAWYRLLKFGRVSRVSIHNPQGGKDDIQLQSFMAMGIGYTFPLQTLLYYALIKAIAQLAQVKGKISVYGDDLIYPVQIHKYVVKVLSELGFLLNLDKSFATGYFRESCGGDYYKGIDVRPAMVDFHHSPPSLLHFVSSIYKLYNSLTRRWSKEEIPKTLEYLEGLVYATLGRVHYVPSEFPDPSGIKSSNMVVNSYHSWNRAPLKKLKSGSFAIDFTSISYRPKGVRVEPKDQLAYLWWFLALRHSPDRGEVVWEESFRTEIVSESGGLLYWRDVKLQKRGKKFRRLRAYVSSKVEGSVRETTGSHLLIWPPKDV